jgi:D-alanine-D-alanine ligase
VALLIDQEQRVDGDPSLTSRQALRHAPMEYYLARALRELAHEVAIVPSISGRQLVTALVKTAPEVVFNGTEQMYGRRTADAHIAAVLELLRLPYTGASPASLLLCRDKGGSKTLVASAGVPVPPFAVFTNGSRSLRGLPPFPLVVKPLSGDASEGISLRSVVNNARHLDERLRLVHRRYPAAIVESFIPGMDIYVFVLEGRTLRILEPQKLTIRGDGASRSMATSYAKYDDAYRRRWGIHHEPADLDDAAVRRIRRYVRQLWPVLKLRDYARIDFRLTPSGEIYFIEANPNPGFSPASRAQTWPWSDYLAAVRTLIGNAVKRGASLPR